MVDINNYILRINSLFIFCLVFNLLLLNGQDINMQNGTFSQCSGSLFDSGGSSGNYGNNENVVLTICSPNAGEAVNLDFSSFMKD